MRKKQAAPDLRMADEMGVSSYIPKNVKSEERTVCVYDLDTCERSATHEVSLTSAETGEATKLDLCERHSKDAQVDYMDYTVTVRRRKLS